MLSIFNIFLRVVTNIYKLLTREIINSNYKMVLGLMDFLLGGKKKNKVPKTGQVSSTMSNANNSGPTGAPQMPTGSPHQETTQAPQQNVGTPPPAQDSTLQFEDNTNQQNSSPQPQQQSDSGFGQNKRSVSEVINKIHGELKSSNERLTGLVGDVKNLENTVNTIGHRLDELEETKKVTDEKFAEIDENMTKFLSLYELINNQYNPFVDKEATKDTLNYMPPKQQQVVGADGNSVDESDGVNDLGLGADDSPEIPDELSGKKSVVSPKMVNIGSSDYDSSLLELDTLDIEDAAGNAVPLTHLKNNTNSLVVILSWLEYLIKKAGIEETRNTLRYYTEVLRWITPEVYFDLDKYLRGMKDRSDLAGDEKLSVRDHIVSLYFISKLNEKALDEKLTKAVLQIIKQ